jgi:hypothetical protein
MRPEDRMIIRAAGGTAPAVKGLEWKYVARDTWIGRLPGENSAPATEHTEHAESLGQ